MDIRSVTMKPEIVELHARETWDKNWILEKGEEEVLNLAKVSLSRKMTEIITDHINFSTFNDIEKNKFVFEGSLSIVKNMKKESIDNKKIVLNLIEILSNSPFDYETEILKNSIVEKIKNNEIFIS